MNSLGIWHAVANGVSLGCLIGLLAVGYSLVYGVAKLINFAHGDVFALSGYFVVSFATAGSLGRLHNALYLLICISGVATYACGRQRLTRSRSLALASCGAIIGGGIGYLLLGIGGPLLVDVLFATLFSALTGIAVEYMIYRPLEGSSRLNYLVAAIGLSLFLQGLMQLLFGTDRRQLPASDGASISALPVPGFLVGYFSGLDLLIIVFTVLLTLCSGWFARRSVHGIALRAAADNPVLAKRLGVDISMARAQVFAFGSALAGVCAFFFVARERVLEPTLGYNQGILAFAAAVIGGIGNFEGALLGGLLIGMILSVLPLVPLEDVAQLLPSGWIQFLPSLNLSDWGLGLVYIVMAAVLIGRPRGLLAERSWRDA